MKRSFFFVKLQEEQKKQNEMTGFYIFIQCFVSSKNNSCRPGAELSCIAAAQLMKPTIYHYCHNVSSYPSQ